MSKDFPVLVLLLGSHTSAEARSVCIPSHIAITLSRYRISNAGFRLERASKACHSWRWIPPFHGGMTVSLNLMTVITTLERWERERLHDFYSEMLF
ncbi:hypothetical protein [Methylotuvimicrobium buryatense]|uniref:hypothetical protein n=1 Tax=Methylotuvimicrobium buryatense TaxID=95641 RepID=UPI0015869EFB|nr:hypothetical protein [Methylotuvimicrobium buryatense]